MLGIVKWLDPVKGYGFLSINGEDVFLHASKISEQDVSVSEFDILDVELDKTDNGLRVSKIISVQKNNHNPNKIEGIAKIKMLRKDYGFLFIDDIEIFVGKQLIEKIRDVDDKKIFVGAIKKEKGMVAHNIRLI